MIRSISIAAAAAVFAFTTATTSAAASQASAVKETVRMAFAKSDSGDAAGALAMFADKGSVIDEFAPFRWTSFAEWFKAYDAYSKENGITAPRTKIVKFAHVNVEKGGAYVVATALFTFKENGKARREPGTMVLSLENRDPGWRITSFAWFGKSGVDAGADASAIVDTAHTFASMSAPASPPPMSIVDEFAPFQWEGESANAQWYEELKRTSAASGSSDMALKLDAPSQLSVNGDKGYGVFPTVIDYKDHGKPAAEHGGFAFSFAKSAGAWHIVSWAWATK